MRVLLVSLLIVLADQVTKLLVKGLTLPGLGIAWPGVPYGSSRPVLGDFLRLTYIENPGMAFGLDLGGKPFFAVLSIVVSLMIVWFLYTQRRERLAFRLSLALLLGGAAGNLVDRVFYGWWFDGGALLTGKVVDFIDVDFFAINIGNFHLHRWPIFNIADTCVTVGVILLFFFHRTAVLQPAPEDASSSSTGGAPGADRPPTADADPVPDAPHAARR